MQACHSLFTLVFLYVLRHFVHVTLERFCKPPDKSFIVSSQMKPMLTTIGTLDPPLGNARLQASKLIAAILATNSDTINAELANLGTLQVLWVCN